MPTEAAPGACGALVPAPSMFKKEVGMDDTAQGGRTEITPLPSAGVYIMSAILLKQSHLMFRHRRQTIWSPSQIKLRVHPGDSSEIVWFFRGKEEQPNAKVHADWDREIKKCHQQCQLLLRKEKAILIDLEIEEFAFI